MSVSYTQLLEQAKESLHALQTAIFNHNTQEYETSDGRRIQKGRYDSEMTELRMQIREFAPLAAGENGSRPRFILSQLGRPRGSN